MGYLHANINAFAQKWTTNVCINFFNNKSAKYEENNLAKMFRIWFGGEHRVPAGPPLRQARHEGLIQVNKIGRNLDILYVQEILSIFVQRWKMQIGQD